MTDAETSELELLRKFRDKRLCVSAEMSVRSSNSTITAYIYISTLFYIHQQKLETASN